MRRTLSLLPALLGLLLLAPGCTTLQEIANLRNVEFDLDRVGNGLVAGVDLDRLMQTQRVGVADGARITAAALRGEVPPTPSRSSSRWTGRSSSTAPKPSPASTTT